MTLLSQIIGGGTGGLGLWGSARGTGGRGPPGYKHGPDIVDRGLID